MTLIGTLISQVVRRSFGLKADALIAWLEERLTDHSQALPKALARANDCAWVAVGLALCEDSFLDRCKDVFRTGDMKGLRDAIREFLAVTPTGLPESAASVRAQAWKEWQRLRKNGRFAIDSISSTEIAGSPGDLQRFGDATGLAMAAHKAMEEVAARIQPEAPNLALVLMLVPPEGGVPLLAVAFTFFFRREIETKPEAYRGLSFDMLRTLTARQDEGLSKLEALIQNRAEGFLGQLDAMFEALDQGFSEVFRKIDELPSLIADIIAKSHISTESSSPLRISVTNERELERLRQMRDAMRSVPAELLKADDLSKAGDVFAAAGWYPDAQKTHQAAAKCARETANRAMEAEAEFKTFRDACETSDWAEAALALRRAVELDRERYEPFPFDRYELVSVLGAGAFGTVFHCRDQFELNDHDRPIEVAIKTLNDEDLGQELQKIFAESANTQTAQPSWHHRHPRSRLR